MIGLNFDLGEDIDMLRDAVWAFAQKEIANAASPAFSPLSRAVMSILETASPLPPGFPF